MKRFVLGHVCFGLVLAYVCDSARSADSQSEQSKTNAILQIKAAAAKDTSPDQLYIEQLQRVAGLVRQHGKTVLVWSDMLAKYPKLISQIPPGTIVVPWGYDATVYEPYWAPFASLPIPKIGSAQESVKRCELMRLR